MASISKTLSSTQNNEINSSKKFQMKVYFEDESGQWRINNRWYIVRNDKNFYFRGPIWAKYFYSLVYIPIKSSTDAGYYEEIKVSENTKKTIYTLIIITTLSAFYVSSVYLIPHIVKNIFNSCANILFNQRAVIPFLITTATGFYVGNSISSSINDSEYNTWLAQNKGLEVFNEFDSLLSNIADLDEFRDPITLSLINDPVRSPFGQLYNRSSLLMLEKLSPTGMLNDRLKKGAFTMAQVQDAPEVLPKMKSILKNLLVEKSRQELSPGVKLGLNALINDLDEQIRNYLCREIRRISDQLGSREITLGQFFERKDDIIKRMM